MTFEHLKHLTDDDKSPLLLAACITGHDYNDALMILREQGCKFAGTVKAGDRIETGLMSLTCEALEHQAYKSIGEYLAFAGGTSAIPVHLEEITLAVAELRNRRNRN